MTMNNNDYETTTGILAAIGAPFFMALGFLIWDITWKKAGGSAFALNLFKCNLASILFLIACFIFGFNDESTLDEQIDTDIWTTKSIGFLILSGAIGIIIGDLAWLEAMQMLGATRVLVIDTVKPFFAAGLGWFILKEKIRGIAFCGIALTAVGILLVSLDQNDDGKEEEDMVEEQQEHSVDENVRGVEGKISTDSEDILKIEENCDNESEKITKEPPESSEACQKLLRLSSFSKKSRLARGYFFAVSNVLLDTYGSLLTKQHGKGMSTWTINLIRFGSAGLFMLLLSLCMSIYDHYRTKDKDYNNHNMSQGNESLNRAGAALWYTLPQMKLKDWTKIVIAVIFVTFTCPALSNYALFKIALALAITLGSIAPLYALLLEWPISKKRPTMQATAGAIMAAGGVVFLSILGT